jgi:hypothetical protein
MKEYWYGIAIGFLGSLVVIFSMLAMMPEAMDVYQGKTELKYKVVNGEIDSCVVFKNGYSWKTKSINFN